MIKKTNIETERERYSITSLRSEPDGTSGMKLNLKNMLMPHILKWNQ